MLLNRYDTLMKEKKIPFKIARESHSSYLNCLYIL